MDIETINQRANHYLKEARQPGQLSLYDQFYFCVADTGLVLSDKAMKQIFDIAETLLMHREKVKESSNKSLIELKGRVHELVTGDIGFDDFASAKQMGLWFETGKFITE